MTLGELRNMCDEAIGKQGESVPVYIDARNGYCYPMACTLVNEASASTNPYCHYGITALMIAADGLPLRNPLFLREPREEAV